MSETAHEPAHSETALFTPVEIEQFEADDVTAGRAIGKMLSILFLYTVLAMALVTWWTYSSLQSAESQNAAPADGHETGH